MRSKTIEGALLLAARLSVVALVLLVWQLAPSRWVPEIAVSRPDEVGEALWDMLSDGDLFRALWSTARGILNGFLVGAPMGVLLGLATSGPRGRWLVEPIVSVGYATPKIALITLFILFVGLTPRTHLIVVASAILFVYFFAMQQAVSEVDAHLVRTFQMLGASRLKRIRSLTLRGSVPYLFAATRIALPIAVTDQIFAEMRVPASDGLGVTLQEASEALNPARSMAVLIVIVVLAFTLDVVLRGRMLRYASATGTGASL